MILGSLRLVLLAFDLIDTAPIVETGGGGNHLYVRLEFPAPAGRKLAARVLTNGKEDLLLETRGQGQYVVAPGSPADTHSSKLPYRLVQGSLCDIQRISEFEFKKMIKLSESFDERRKKLKRGSHPGKAPKPNQAIRDYNERADESELLLEHGYRLQRTDEAGECYWQKPDSSNPGHQMTSNYQGSGLIYNFSTENPPFDEVRSYSKFEALALLKYGGDLKQALAAIKEQSYGSQPSSAKAIAKSIIDIALKECKLWHDADGGGYATVIDGSSENYPLNSKRFHDWLSGVIYKTTGKALGRDQIDQVVRILQHESKRGPEHPIGIRASAYKDKVYLDLADDERRVVEIDKDEWRITSDCPIKFIRKPAMSALPVPEPGGDLNEFLDLLNLPDGNARMLFIGFMLGAFMPGGPFVIIVLYGECGTGKTSAARAIKYIVDPSDRAPLRSRPKDEPELLLWAQGCLVLALDNLSYLPAWLSDSLCRLSTGGGHSVRKLYTNDDEFFLDAQRPVILTGIEDLLNRGDAIDRSISIHLPQITDEKRLSEEEVWTRLKRDRPKILGALLDAVSGALKNRSTTMLPSKPRMADFAIWVTAAEETLGWEKGSFLAAYQANRREAFEIGLDSSTFYKLLCLAMEPEAKFTGTATELHARLRPFLNQLEDSRVFPKHPSKTSGELRKIAPALRQTGWTVKFTKTKQRLIEIVRPVEPQVSQSSVDSVEASESPLDGLP